MEIRAILWPTESYTPSQKIIDAVVTLAERFQAKIYVLHAVTPIPIFPESVSAVEVVPTFDVGLYEHELVKTAKKSLAAVARQQVPEGMDAESHVVVGHPRDVILDFVEEKNIDVVVMATHGRSGVDRLLIGSVAESTIRHCPVPLFVIPLGQDETTEKPADNA